MNKVMNTSNHNPVAPVVATVAGLILAPNTNLGPLELSVPDPMHPLSPEARAKELTQGSSPSKVRHLMGTFAPKSDIAGRWELMKLQVCAQRASLHELRAWLAHLLHSTGNPPDPEVFEARAESDLRLLQELMSFCFLLTTDY